MFLAVSDGIREVLFFFSQVFMGEPCVQGTPWEDSLLLGIAAKRNCTDGYGFLAGLSEVFDLACARLRILVGWEVG